MKYKKCSIEYIAEGTYGTKKYEIHMETCPTVQVFFLRTRSDDCCKFRKCHYINLNLIKRNKRSFYLMLLVNIICHLSSMMGFKICTHTSTINLSTFLKTAKSDVLKLCNTKNKGSKNL